MTAEVQIELQSSTLRAAVDGPAVNLSAVVRNAGTVVDQYALSVEGIEAPWWQISPPTVSLFPGESATVELSVHLPAGAVAGDYRASLRAVSQDDPSRVATAGFDLNVAAGGALGLSLEPPASEGRLGKHLVKLSNRRNAALALSLAGFDPEEGLEYTFVPPNLVVQPFAEGAVDLEVRPKKGRLSGNVSEHAFTVRAFAEGSEEPEAEAEGELRYKPLLGAVPLPAGRWRWLLALVPLFALALWAVASVVVPPGGGAGSTPTPAASAIAGAGSTVTPSGGASGGIGPAIKVAAGRAEEGVPRAVLVSWEAEGAESAEGSLAAAGQGPSGEPSRQGAYLVKASGQGGSAADAVEVVALGPPIIKQYYPKQVIAGGGVAQFALDIAAADEVEIEGPGGLYSVDPNAKETEIRGLREEDSGAYILKARNAVGEVSTLTYITVEPTAPPPTPIPTFTPTVTPSPSPEVTPACALKTFSVTPESVQAPFAGQVTFKWSASDVKSVRVRWNDLTGGSPAKEVVAASTSWSAQATVNATSQGTITFSIVAYRDEAATEPACAGPLTDTLSVGQPPCVVNSFAVSPANPGWSDAGQYPTAFTWNTSNVAGVAISWTDASGAHRAVSGNGSGSLQQTVQANSPGEVAFSLSPYRDAAAAEPACGGAVTQKIVIPAPPPCAIDSFSITPTSVVYPPPFVIIPLGQADEPQPVVMEARSDASAFMLPAEESILSFASPAEEIAAAPIAHYKITFNWNTSNAKSIAVKWTDAAGPHTFTSTQASGSAEQDIQINSDADFQFSLYTYRDASATEPACAGPKTATLKIDRPPCSIASFTVSPVSVIGSGWRGNVTLNWNAPNVDSIAITWTDSNGPHSFTSTSSAGSTSQFVYRNSPGPITFSLVGYRGSGSSQTQCAGPVTATTYITKTTTFTATTRCVSGSSPTVTLNWTVVGGPDARVYIYRNKQNAPTGQTLLGVSNTQLSGSFTDRPPAGTLYNYTLRVVVTGGATENTTQPATPLWANCIY